MKRSLEIRDTSASISAIWVRYCVIWGSSDRVSTVGELTSDIEEKRSGDVLTGVCGAMMTSIAVIGGVETENVSANPTPKIITRCAITEINKARWDLNTLEVEDLARDAFGIVT